MEDKPELTPTEISEYQDFDNLDDARELFAQVIGTLSTMTREEQARDNPDKLKIMTYKAAVQSCRDLREKLLDEDCLALGKALYLYGPLLKGLRDELEII